MLQQGEPMPPGLVLRECSEQVGIGLPQKTLSTVTGFERAKVHSEPAAVDAAGGAAADGCACSTANER
jgi:hypothetical protein